MVLFSHYVGPKCLYTLRLPTGPSIDVFGSFIRAWSLWTKRADVDWVLRKVLAGWIGLAAMVRSHHLLIEVKAGSWSTYPQT